MKIHAHPTGDTEGWIIEPAEKGREWMDSTPNRFAYRCLPLVMANQAGWVIRCPVSFSVRWNGRSTHEKSLKFSFKRNPERYAGQILSNFGAGIVTFAIPWLFKTTEEIELNVRGLPNNPKLNCSPLEGCVETAWSPYSFTMNWKISLPWLPVHFEEGEPICFIQPISLKGLEEAEPEFIQKRDDSPVQCEHRRWANSRLAFNRDPKRGSDWQKHYFKGISLDGHAIKGQHRTSLNLRKFDAPWTRRTD